MMDVFKTVSGGLKPLMLHYLLMSHPKCIHFGILYIV